MVHEGNKKILLMRLPAIIAAFLLSMGAFAQLVPHEYSYSVDNFPDVYGGRVEWKRFLHDHMIYPKYELEKKIEGPVKIFFVVTKQGKPARAKVTQGVSEGLDKEALRLLSLLEWMPSYQGDSAVNVQHSVEINFSVSKYKKWVKARGYEMGAYTDLPLDSTFAIHESADKAPSFTDPEKTFPEFVYTSLDYPVIAKQQGLEGNIVMSFIVEPDGRTSNIRIQKGVGGGCNEEAIRVIGLTKWKPAQKNGKYVRYRMFYTMIFSLKSAFKDNSNGTQRGWGQ